MRCRSSAPSWRAIPAASMSPVTAFTLPSSIRETVTRTRVARCALLKNVVMVRAAASAASSMRFVSGASVSAHGVASNVTAPTTAVGRRPSRHST